MLNTHSSMWNATIVGRLGHRDTVLVVAIIIVAAGPRLLVVVRVIVLRLVLHLLGAWRARGLSEMGEMYILCGNRYWEPNVLCRVVFAPINNNNQTTIVTL